MIGRSAASLAVHVDVNTKAATAGLTAFDKRLERSAAKAKAATAHYDSVGESVQAIDARKTSEQLRLFDSTMVKSSKTAETVSKSYDKVGASSKALGKDVEDTDVHVRKSSDGFRGFSKNIITASASIHILSKAVGLLKWPAMIAAVGYATEGIAALGGGVVALTGALAPLSGALASAGAGLLLFGQVRATMALTGLKDVTGAVGGLNEKLDTSADAFKQLSPEAQKFARTLQDAKKPIRDLQAEVQKPMFRGMNAGLDAAMKALPAVEKLLTGTARRMGGIFERIGKFLGSKGFSSDLLKVGRTNNQVLGKLGGTVVHLAKGFMDLVVVARPLTKWFGNLFARWGKGISQATELNRKNGDMADFFRKTKDVAQDMIGIFKNVGAALINISKAGAPLGRMIIDKLVQGSRELKKWTESASGQNSIAKFFHDIKPPLWEAGRLLVDFTKAFFSIQGRTSGALAPLLKQLRTELLPVLVDLVSETTKAFGPRLVDLLVQVAKLMGSLAGTSGPLNIFVETLTRISRGLNWLIQNVPGFQKVVVTLGAMFAIGKAFNFASAITGISTLGKGVISLGTAFAQTGSVMGVIGAKWPGLAAAISRVTGAMQGLTLATIRAKAAAAGIFLWQKLVGVFAAVKAAVLGLSLTVRGAMLATGIGALIVGAGLIVTNWDKVKAALGKVWDWIKGAAGTVAKAVGRAWEWLKNAARNVVKAIVAAFKWLADKVVTAAKFGLLGPIPLIISRWKEVVGFLKKVWGVIKDVAKGAFEVVKKVIINPLKSAWNWIKDAFGNIGKWFADRFGNVKDALKGALSGIGNIVSGMFGGIKDGVVSALNWVIDRINDLIGAYNKLPFVGDIDEIGAIGGGGNRARRTPSAITAHPRGGAGERIRGGQQGGIVTDRGIVPIYGFQQGGMVGAGSGRGPGPKDTVAAMLQPGEIVLPVDWVKKFKSGTDGLAKMIKKVMAEITAHVRKGGGQLSKFARDAEKGLKVASGKGRGSLKALGVDLGDKLGKQGDRAGKAVGKFAKKGEKDFDQFSNKSRKSIDKLGQEMKGPMDRQLDRSERDVNKFSGKAAKSMDQFSKRGQKSNNAFVGSMKSMVSASSKAINQLGTMINRAMSELGLQDRVSFGSEVVDPKKGGGGGGQPRRRQQGGLIPGLRTGALVPGIGSGDTVPLHMGGKLVAMVEPSEYVSVANRTATAKLMAINNQVKRRADGGEVAGGKATGGMAAMLALVNKYEQRSFPYLWGGGHGGFVNATQAVDCSGFVSDVLHAGGLLDGAPMVSGALANWGQPASGSEPLVVYANAGHTLMSLNGRFAGTSSTNPDGGAGWLSDQSAGYLSGFAKRTMDVAGGIVKELKRIMLTGPDGPVKAIGQAAVDMVQKAGNEFISDKMPSGALGGGQPLKDLPKSLWKYNKQYAEAPAPSHLSAPKMPFNAVAALDEWAGMPGVSMAKTAIGESALAPGASGIDPGGTKGLGLHMITTGFNDALISRLGGQKSMFNPVINAQAAKSIWDAQGWGAWYSTTKDTSNTHYDGPLLRQHGGLVAGLQTGGLIEPGTMPTMPTLLAKPEAGAGAASPSGAKDGKGGKGGKRIRSLTDLVMATVGAVRHENDDRTKKATERWAEAIKAFGLPEKLVERMVELREDADMYAEYAGNASSLGDEGELGKFRSKTEAEWLQKLLSALWKLRQRLIVARRKLEKKIRESVKALDVAEKQYRQVSKAISGQEAEKEKADLERRLEKAKEAKNKDLTKHLEDKLKSLEERQSLRQAVASVLKKPIISSLKALDGRLENGDTEFGSLTSVEEHLKTVQGNVPFRRFARLPKLGILGGEIFDTQLRLRDLAAEANPVVEGISFSELRDVIEAARFGVYDSALGLQTFHTGGIVPGSGDQPIVAKGGEGVFTREQMTAMAPAATTVNVENNISFDGLDAVIETKIDGQIVKRERKQHHRLARQVS